jgi:hypothetical protein
VSEFGGRVLSTTAVPPAASNLRALLLWPVPGVWADTSRLLAMLFIWPVGATLAASAVVAALTDRARVWLQVAALLLCLTPTAFFQFNVETITPRRYLYLAGVPLCLLVGSAVAHRLHRDTSGRPTTPMVLSASGLLVAVVLAGASQFTLWHRVAVTARCAMDDFGRQIAGVGAVPAYVENMPFAVNHGPFILLPYDFRYAHGQRSPAADVAFRQTVLALDRNGSLIVEGHGEAPQDVARRRPLSLNLCLVQDR